MAPEPHCEPLLLDGGDIEVRRGRVAFLLGGVAATRIARRPLYAVLTA